MYGQDDWIWDAFNFQSGYIGSAPYYYLALDFSDNVFDGLSSILVDCGIGSSVELVTDADKIVILEVKNAKVLTITQIRGDESMTQSYDLSLLEYS